MKHLNELTASYLLIFALTACTAMRPSRTLTVFAAASLTESFSDLGKQFEAAHPNVKVVLNFAGSQQLRAQLEQGARADVFAAANVKEMNTAIGSSLVVSGTQRIFARNRLMVIYPKSNPGRITSLTDLARPFIELILSPSGQQTLVKYGFIAAETP